MLFPYATWIDWCFSRRRTMSVYLLWDKISFLNSCCLKFVLQSVMADGVCMYVLHFLWLLLASSQSVPLNSTPPTSKRSWKSRACSRYYRHCIGMILVTDPYKFTSDCFYKNVFISTVIDCVCYRVLDTHDIGPVVTNFSQFINPRHTDLLTYRRIPASLQCLETLLETISFHFCHRTALNDVQQFHMRYVQRDLLLRELHEAKLHEYHGRCNAGIYIHQ